MKLRLFIFFLGMASMAVTLHSCYRDNEEDLYGGSQNCDTTNLVYNGRIKTIVSNSCLSGCHSQVAGSGGIILEGYINLKNEAMNGQVMCAIRHQGCNPMPRNSAKLSDCDINALQKWIDTGYPEN